MSQPQWITPATNLGTIPELEYYEFPLDAYDPSSGTLTFSLVSGKLPLGLQIIPTGKIQGVPVSELTGDVNVEYRFTIRVRNADKQVSDRTFSITITNIAPPIIVPKNIDLGIYFDGTYINAQLDAIEATPSASLTWKLIDGELPLGLTLTSTGKITGYLQAIPAIGTGATAGWDLASWDSKYNTTPLGWDYTTDLIKKYYKFKVQVYDGVNIDESYYELVVIPRQDLIINNISDQDGTADITADTTQLRLGYDFATDTYTNIDLTVSETDKHAPIILTTQDDLISTRQDSYYAFQFKALDLDSDQLKFIISTLGGSAFDESSFDMTKFDQDSLSIPGGHVIKETTYISLGSSGTTFKIADTSGLYPGLLVAMDSGLGGDRIITEVVDSTTLILSLAPDGILTDGSAVIISQNSTLTLDENSGWLYGRLPTQTAHRVVYEFEITVYKAADTTYTTSKLFQLIVYRDLSDIIEWVTPTDIGSIENGNISDFLVQARSSSNKKLYYTLTPGGKQRLPQGLALNSEGLIYGRASFELFTLDSGTTTIDAENTLFDTIYEFDVTAQDLENTVSVNKLFKIQVVYRNSQPFENLYLKALTSRYQRTKFLDIINNQDIFPQELIYRNSDPYYGLARDLKFLFLPGLEPSLLSEYMNGVSFNHFTKRIILGDVKTAVALDENFNVKYEVVYIEVIDTASNESGGSATSIQNLVNLIRNPYYDADGNSYNIAYPNGFNNMKESVLNYIGYANKGALPGWMTSNQPDPTNSVAFKSPLGLTHGVVLAYTVPGASNTIAYRLKNSIDQQINFNEFDFTVDRYQLDNVYSTNYNSATNKYIASQETTFDRYVSAESIYYDKGLVHYALSVPYEDIHLKTVSEIQANGGMDGIMDFSDGEYIVFAKQEFLKTITISSQLIDVIDYNFGWSDVQVSWDENSWAFNTNTLDNDTLDAAFDTTPGEKWNEIAFVPGYQEYIDLGVTNKRAGIWKININSANIVTLTLVSAMDYFDTVFVYNGFTYSGTTIFLDPAIKDNQAVPAYSIVPRIQTYSPTTFDGNGTRFLSNRDLQVAPEEGDKYIKFAKLGVFT